MSRRFLLLPVLQRKYLPSHRNYVWGLYLYTFWNAYQTKCILPNLLPVSFHWSQWSLCQNKVTYSLAAIQRPGQHVGIKSNKMFRKFYGFGPHLLISSMNTGLSPPLLPRNPSSLVLTWPAAQLQLQRHGQSKRIRDTMRAIKPNFPKAPAIRPTANFFKPQQTSPNLT